MRTMRRSAWAAPLLVVSTLLAACGGGGDDGDAKASGDLSDTELEFVAAWKANLLIEEEDALDVDEDEAQCMAEAIVRNVGVDVFEDADVTPDDISEEPDSPADFVGAGAIPQAAADATVADWDDCIELGVLMAASLNSDGTFDDAAERCIADGLEEDGLGAEAIGSSFTTPSDEEPPKDLTDQIFELIGSCSGGDGEGPSGDEIDADSFIVQMLAAGFREDGTLDEEQSLCAAQYVVNAIGEDRFTSLITENEDFDSLPQEIKDEIASELIASLKPCDIPFSVFSE